MGTRALLGLGLLFASACADPHAERIPYSDAPVPASYGKALESLSPDEKALLDRYFARQGSDYMPPTKDAPGTGARTIGEAIDEQRYWEETHTPAPAVHVASTHDGRQSSAGARAGRLAVGIFKLGLFLAVVVAIITYSVRRSREAKLAGGARCPSCGLANGALQACRRCGGPLS